MLTEVERVIYDDSISGDKIHGGNISCLEELTVDKLCTDTVYTKITPASINVVNGAFKTNIGSYQQNIKCVTNNVDVERYFSNMYGVTRKNENNETWYMLDSMPKYTQLKANFGSNVFDATLKILESTVKLGDDNWNISTLSKTDTDSITFNGLKGTTAHKYAVYSNNTIALDGVSSQIQVTDGSNNTEINGSSTIISNGSSSLDIYPYLLRSKGSSDSYYQFELEDTSGNGGVLTLRYGDRYGVIMKNVWNKGGMLEMYNSVSSGAKVLAKLYVDTTGKLELDSTTAGTKMTLTNSNMTMLTGSSSINLPITGSYNLATGSIQAVKLDMYKLKFTKASSYVEVPDSGQYKIGTTTWFKKDQLVLLDSGNSWIRAGVSADNAFYASKTEFSILEKNTYKIKAYYKEADKSSNFYMETVKTFANFVLKDATTALDVSGNSGHEKWGISTKNNHHWMYWSRNGVDTVMVGSNSDDGGNTSLRIGRGVKDINKGEVALFSSKHSHIVIRSQSTNDKMIVGMSGEKDGDKKARFFLNKHDGTETVSFDKGSHEKGRGMFNMWQPRVLGTTVHHGVVWSMTSIIVGSNEVELSGWGNGWDSSANPPASNAAGNVHWSVWGNTILVRVDITIPSALSIFNANGPAIFRTTITFTDDSKGPAQMGKKIGDWVGFDKTKHNVWGSPSGWSCRLRRSSGSYYRTPDWAARVVESKGHLCVVSEHEARQGSGADKVCGIGTGWVKNSGQDVNNRTTEFFTMQITDK